MSTIQQKLIQNGVRNLREFGYPECNETNILTDYVYAQFFKGMLEDNRGQGFDKDIDAVLAMIKTDKP